MNRRQLAVCIPVLLGSSCANDNAGKSNETSTADVDTSGTEDSPDHGRVHVVLFTHIEDNTPGGMLGSMQSRMGYSTLRSKLIDMAELAQTHDLQWVLQPDWKILEAAHRYRSSRNGIVFVSRSMV